MGWEVIRCGVVGHGGKLSHLLIWITGRDGSSDVIVYS